MTNKPIARHSKPRERHRGREGERNRTSLSPAERPVSPRGRRPSDDRPEAGCEQAQCGAGSSLLPKAERELWGVGGGILTTHGTGVEGRPSECRVRVPLLSSWPEVTAFGIKAEMEEVSRTGWTGEMSGWCRS